MNLKEIQVGSGKEENVYLYFTNFTSQKMRQHVGLYILHGLALLPNISDMFKFEIEDVIH